MNIRSLKIFAIALALAVTTFGGSAAQAQAKPFRIAVVMPSASTDMAFSQSMFTALKTIQKQMGGESALKLSFSENMYKVPDAAAAIRDYASQGYDIVIAHGSQYGSSVDDIAREFPKTTFAWGTDVNTFGLKNVYAYTAAAEEGGYVNGVLAAKLTKSKVIGVTGPVKIGDAKTYVSGFTQGVKSVDPSIRVSETWTGSFSDVAMMAEAAKTHIAAGADVLTGSSQAVIGSIGAAKAKGKVLWFGTQQDEAPLAPTIVVASQQYDWVGILKKMISDRKTGKLGGEKFVLQLNNGGLKIVYNPAFKLSASAKAAGDKAIQGIAKGTIKVTP
jgi:basic membrane protein A